MASPLSSALKNLVDIKSAKKDPEVDSEGELDRDLADIYDDYEKASDSAARARALKAFIRRSSL